MSKSRRGPPCPAWDASFRSFLKVFLKTGIRDWSGWSLLPFFPILLGIQNRAVPQRSWLLHALSDGIMPLKHLIPAWLSCKRESMSVCQYRYKLIAEVGLKNCFAMFFEITFVCLYESCSVHEILYNNLRSRVLFRGRISVTIERTLTSRKIIYKETVRNMKILIRKKKRLKQFFWIFFLRRPIYLISSVDKTTFIRVISD